MTVEDVQRTFRELTELGLIASPSKPETMERYEQLANEILEKVDRDRIVLLQQWIYCLNDYVVTQGGDRRSNMAMAMQYLLERYDIEPIDMAYAFYPLLDAHNEGLRVLAEKYLVWSHKSQGGSGVDFGIYETILKEELKGSGDLPASLVKYMYERAPGDAVISMMQLDEKGFGSLKSALEITEDRTKWPLTGRRRLQVTDKHPKQKIATELESLSARPEWWVQLLVAEFITQVPDVGTESIRSNLSASGNSLVKLVLENPHKYDGGDPDSAESGTRRGFHREKGASKE